MSYDHTIERLGWQVSRVGQGILIEDDKMLLCGNRWYTGKPLVWTLPGGRAEESEGVAEGLIREFREETGLEIEVGALAYVAEARSLIRRQLFLTCAFLVTCISGELTHAGDAAVEALQFVPFSDLPQYLPSPSIGDPLRWYIQHPAEAARYWYFPEYTAK